MDMILDETLHGCPKQRGIRTCIGIAHHARFVAERPALGHMLPETMHPLSLQGDPCGVALFIASLTRDVVFV